MPFGKMMEGDSASKWRPQQEGETRETLRNNEHGRKQAVNVVCL